MPLGDLSPLPKAFPTNTNPNTIDGATVLGMTEQPTRLNSVCPECSQVFTRDDTKALCSECLPNRTWHPTHIFKGSPESRGYDRTWRALSRRARRAQPFCIDCGTPDDLTADHSPTAWARRDAGQVIRLEDVDVVCRRCNSERGPARGDGAESRPARLVLPLDPELNPADPLDLGDDDKQLDA